jgi:threonine aldolase
MSPRDKGLMIFASDNWSGASERILAAFAKAAASGGPAYGADALTAAASERFNEIFEREVVVFFVASGTVANALALSAYARPGGIVFTHGEAHIAMDEGGAFEFFSGGNRIATLPATAGKISADAVASALAGLPEGDVHRGRPVAVSLTQITEHGAAYRPDEIAEVARAAKARGLAVHMDGARFAGAVAALGLSPAEITWRAGVDVLSFGGTKNGCFAAEAVVFFDPGAAGDFAYARQRAGQGYSKNWFIAAQFLAYFDNSHWLELAGHANRMAARLAGAIATSGSARLALYPDANEIFAVVKNITDARLRAAGAVYHRWPAAGLIEVAADETMIRLVTSFQTSDGDVDRFAALL